MTPLGILGGAFDPVHFGHLRLAQEAASLCRIDCVRMIPTGIPPHRNPPLASASQRMDMLEIAVRGNPVLVPDDREIRKNTPCYTIETLQEIRSEEGREKPICLILGADAFMGFLSWKNWREIFRYAHIVVAKRPGFSIESQMPQTLKEEFLMRLNSDPESLHFSPHGNIVMTEITLLDISSSKIRQYVREGKSPSYLLPEGVLDYIRANRLYQEMNEH